LLDGTEVIGTDGINNDNELILEDNENDNDSENDGVRVADGVNVKMAIGVSDGIILFVRVNLSVGLSLGLILGLILDNSLG